VYNDFGLYKIDVAGGDPVHLGNYRGGACKPDGSELIAVFEPPSGNWPDDSKLFLMDYAGQLVGSGFRPSAFFGQMVAVSWCQDGDSLLVTSNTNAAYCVSNIVGDVSRSFSGPIWGKTVSPVLNSPYIVVSGTGESTGGIFSINILDGSFEQLVLGDSWYYPGPAIAGATVNQQGTSVVFSMRKKINNDYQEHGDLYSIPYEGGLAREMLASPVEELYPAWSPDGTKVVFSSNRSGAGFNLYLFTVTP